MKKLLLPICIVLLAACNANNSNADPAADNAGPDTTRLIDPTDTTNTTNNNAYNTTDTGMSRGSITDSSGSHTTNNH